MILEFPNYIDKEFIDYIKQEVQPYLQNATTSCGNRTGITVPISKESGLKNLDNRLHTLMLKIQTDIASSFEPLFGSGDNGYEYHKYGIGQSCKAHADGEVDINNLSDKGTSSIRYASVIIHLTTNTGGELVFPKQNRSIKTKAGKVVVFPPYGTHRHYTTPAKEEREVIVTWFTLTDLYAQRR